MPEKLERQAAVGGAGGAGLDELFRAASSSENKAQEEPASENTLLQAALRFAAVSWLVLPAGRPRLLIQALASLAISFSDTNRSCLRTGASSRHEACKRTVGAR
jgi:hypothetical protein